MPFGPWVPGCSPGYSPPTFPAGEKRVTFGEQCRMFFSVREHGLKGFCTRPADHRGSHRVDEPLFGREVGVSG